MSHDEEPSEQVDAAANQIVRLKLKDYDNSKSGTHTFFSHFRPDYLLEQLTEKLGHQGQEYTVSDSTWKLNFEASKTIGEEADGMKEKTKI